MLNVYIINHRFTKVDPIQFRIGDIVEAQITLTGVTD